MDVKEHTQWDWKVIFNVARLPMSYSRRRLEVVSVCSARRVGLHDKRVLKHIGNRLVDKLGSFASPHRGPA